jgi:hypothetical protein
MPFSEDGHAVGHLGEGGENEPFRVGVRLLASWRDLVHGEAGGGQRGVEGGSELPGSITDEDFELVGAFTEVGEQIPGLLGRPRPVGVTGDAEDVHLPAADLDDEEHVQALEGERAVQVEEMISAHRGCLGGKEPPPRGVVAACRHRYYVQPFEDPADRGRTDAVAEVA